MVKLALTFPNAFNGIEPPSQVRCPTPLQNDPELWKLDAQPAAPSGQGTLSPRATKLKIRPSLSFGRQTAGGYAPLGIFIR